MAAGLAIGTVIGPCRRSADRRTSGERADGGGSNCFETTFNHRPVNPMHDGWHRRSADDPPRNSRPIESNRSESFLTSRRQHDLSGSPGLVKPRLQGAVEAE